MFSGFSVSRNVERRIDFSIWRKLEGGSSWRKLAIFHKKYWKIEFLTFFDSWEIFKSKVKILPKSFYETYHKLSISVPNDTIGRNSGEFYRFDFHSIFQKKKYIEQI